MGYNSCSKHAASKAVGKCGDCGVYFCASCRRYHNGIMYCRSCYQKRWYKDNKQFKDKLQHGLYSSSTAQSSTSIISTFIQTLIIGILGIIAYKFADNKGWLTKENLNNIKQSVSSLKNPADIYSAKNTGTRLKSFKKIADMYKASNGSYPKTFDIFIDEMFENDQKEINKTDAWGNKIIYRYDSSDDVYEFISCGADKTLDTEDDIIVTNKKNK